MKKKIVITEINDGFREPVLKDEDYIFGGGQIEDEILRVDGQWDSFLPSEEAQFRPAFDTYGCTVFGTTNQIEIYQKAKFGEDHNYSDRGAYIMADIAPPGADPQAIYETLRHNGLLDENILPWDESFKNVQEYSSPKPLPSRLYDTARSWLTKWLFRHEWLEKDAKGYVSTKDMLEALKRSPLGVAVYAWASDGEKYVRAGEDTHWTVITGTYENGDWKCWDSYPPYRKRLDKNFKFKWAKRIRIDKNPTEEEIVSIKSRLISLIQTLLPFLFKRVEELKTETVSAVQPSEPKPKYKWGTRVDARHSVRLICDEELPLIRNVAVDGNLYFPKDIITAVIEQESQFDTQATNANPNGTVDYGICQMNTKWYIGPGKPIKDMDEALNNPEKCVRVMIQMYKKGRLSDWIAYRSGAYKKYLPKIKVGSVRIGTMFNENRFLNWLVVSSENPRKIAMTVKGVLLALVPTAVVVLRMFNVDDFGSEQLQTIVDLIEVAVIGILGIVSAVMTVYGAFRKIYLTVKGKS